MNNCEHTGCNAPEVVALREEVERLNRQLEGYAAYHSIEAKLLAAQAQAKKYQEALECYCGGWANDVLKCHWDGIRQEALSTPINTTELDKLVKDAERYRWLRDNHGYNYGMGSDTPAECGIAFGWQQSRPEEANTTIDAAIDAAIKESGVERCL